MNKAWLVDAYVRTANLAVTSHFTPRMAEDLLSLPTAECEDFQRVRTRSSCSYQNGCERYRLQDRNYVTQYAHIYFTRLELMRPHLKAAAIKKWGIILYQPGCPRIYICRLCN